jgi:cellulose synthase/poly-beta-1,6-N-acetylglucosamine synthase-like glycosyltransferase
MRSYLIREGRSSRVARGYGETRIAVVPAYNEEENIPALLEGMREKTGATGRSCDVLVTGDGSRDGTGEIVRSYSTKLSLEAASR